MALTPSRWLTLALLACMGLIVALLPPDGRPLPVIDWMLPGPPYDEFGLSWWRTRDLERNRLALVSRVLSRAESQVEALVLRDSTLTLLRRAAPDTGFVSVVVDGLVPPLAVTRARQLAALEREQLALVGRSEIRSVIAIRRGRSYLSESATLFPGVVSPTTCVTLFTLDSTGRSDALIASGAVAACTYFSAFGTPGRGMAGLLGHRNFDLIRDARFQGPAGFALPGALDPPPSPSLFGIAEAGMPGWRFWSSALARACQVGRRESCERGILQGAPVTPWDSLGLRDRVWDGAVRFWREDRLWEISGSLLPDLVREFGADTVRALWQSDDSLPESFRAATGKPLGDWLAVYVPRKLGRSLSGPVLRWRSAVLTLLIAGLALAASALAANRREAR